MIETVIWDWNGTLLDDLSVSFEATNRLLAANGRAPLADLDCYRAVFSFPVIDYYRRIGFDFDQLPFDQLAQQYMSKFSGFSKYDYHTSCGNYIRRGNYLRWNSSTLSDPNGYKNMTANQILADLFS